MKLKCAYSLTKILSVWLSSTSNRTYLSSTFIQNLLIEKTVEKYGRDPLNSWLYFVLFFLGAVRRFISILMIFFRVSESHLSTNTELNVSSAIDRWARRVLMSWFIWSKPSNSSPDRGSSFSLIFKTRRSLFTGSFHIYSISIWMDQCFYRTLMNLSVLTRFPW